MGPSDQQRIVSRPLDLAISRRRLAEESRSFVVACHDWIARRTGTLLGTRCNVPQCFCRRTGASKSRSTCRRDAPRKKGKKSRAKVSLRSSSFPPFVHRRRIGTPKRDVAPARARRRVPLARPASRMSGSTGAGVRAPPRRATQFPMASERERARARRFLRRTAATILNRHTLTVRERSTVCDGRAHNVTLAHRHRGYLIPPPFPPPPPLTPFPFVFFLFLPLTRRNGRAHGRTKNARSHVGCTSH